jgi:aspartate aminotransferase
MNMGIGQSPFPVPAHMVEALRNNADDGRYVAVKGLPELREAVAEFHKEKDNLEFKSDNIILGPGAKSLIYLAQLAFAGDIIVSSPCWVSYIPQAKMCGRGVHLVDTTHEGRWSIEASKLDELCETNADDGRPKMLILNHPGNPTGLSYTEDGMKAIAEVARKHKLIILSDEIYGMLHHQGRHLSMARYYQEGTIVCSGLSKWGHAAGWRLGTAAFPEELEWLLGGVVKAAGQVYTCVPAPIQHASIAAYRGGEKLDTNLAHSRRILSSVGRECTRKLQEAGVFVHPSDGGFYIFPDFSPFRERLEKKGITDSWKMCERLLDEKHVAITPGAAFERPPKELTARISYTNFDGAKAMAESERIGLETPLPETFTRQLCGTTVESVESIIEWAKSD